MLHANPTDKPNKLMMEFNLSLTSERMEELMKLRNMIKKLKAHLHE